MKKIMIDLDETIITGGYLEVLNKYLNTNYTTEDIKEYYVEDILEKEELEKYLDYFYKDVNVYDYITIIKDAKSVIEKLSKKYDVYICTAFVDTRRVYESGIMAMYKYQWILKNLDFINPKKIIMTGSKELIDCDIKIDDKYSNLKGNAKIKLLLDSYHNKEYDIEKLEERGVVRVNSWKEIESILL